MKGSIAAAVAATCIASNVACATTTLPTVDPHIADVRTGGYWKEDGRDGHYRVVLSHGGWEEINTTVLLEWIATGRGEDRESTVAYSNVLFENLLGSVDISTFTAYPSGVRLELSGLLQDGHKYHCRVDLNPGGIYRKARGC